MKKVAIIFAWFLSSTGIILGLTVLLNTLNSPENTRVALGMPDLANSMVASSSQGYGQNLGEVKGISTTVQAGDAREALLANFLARHDSPLKPYDEYAHKIVAISDKYGIDFRLLPAIAMQESNLCKVIPPGTYNCLGFGIHKRGTLGFDNYEDAFDRAGRELKANYIDEGRVTPYQIMQKYTPSSNGSWAESVNQWMSEMRYDDREKGLELKVNADLNEFVSPQAASPSTK